DLRGETLYLRLKEHDGYQIFSPFFTPTLDALDRYECRVGLGYSRFLSESRGVRTEITVFVPAGGSQEIRDVRITNLLDHPVEVDAVPVVEYTHFDALKQFTNADWVPQTMQSRCHVDDDGCTTLVQYAFLRRDTAVNFFTSSQPASSFETDRRRFLGANEYGTWAHPLSLAGEELSNYQAHRGDNIAALLHHLGPIAPGETVRLVTQLGQVADLAAALPEIRRLRRPQAVDAALAELRAFWSGYLSTLQVDTPDESMNQMLNVYNPRQCHVTLQWSRYLSLYQLGFGARGIGFRDTSQDAMGAVAHAPGTVRALLLKLLHVQRRDGSAYHQFNPLTMVANEGDSREVEEGPHYYGDDHLWIVLAVSAYLKETGDLAFLDEVVPYYEKDRHERPVEDGTVLDHLQRALAFTRDHTGAHGLPLLGFADWNDPTNLPPGAESLFVANLYGRALGEMIDLTRHLEDMAAAERYRHDYDEMKARVHEHAWDGGWYVRYFDAEGKPLGSRTNTHGQIYANGQSWPVLSGFATPDRARMALDAVYARLNTPRGIKLSTPGFDGYDPAVGGISTYPPGAKENGGIFLHANPWVIMAEAMTGHGDRAFEYYHQINPAARNDDIDRFECEPYAYPQNVLGDEHPQFGLARNSWLTGTASWAYQAATQYILGLRPRHDGLEIDPCLPAAWDGFRVTRRFRGALYEIEVENPEHVCCGVRSVTLDGRPLDGNVLPLPNGERHYRVRVVLGA
ncbi:MAG: glycosyl transferase, partial [Anaerolineae bacterium]|nr:glycosyl transferase [Anaerolineae bacterium]